MRSVLKPIAINQIRIGRNPTALHTNSFLVFQSHRLYHRDPSQAEHQATTVRGHRAARLRLSKLSKHSGGSNQGQQRGRPPLAARLSKAWKTTPTVWYPIPILLGAFVLLGVKARRDYLAEQGGNGKGAKIVDENGHVVKMQGPWTVYVIGALPLNAISRAWGWANNIELPLWFRPFGFKLYAWIFGCNLDEMKDPDLTHYKSLGEFFYRELEEGAREIDDALLVSPADGKVLHFGVIKERRVEQVKGITYSLDALLGTTSMPETTDVYNRDSHYETINEENFAKVNGIDYSLDRLLGDEKKQKARAAAAAAASLPKGARKLVSWRWWKSWVVKPSKIGGGSSTTAAAGSGATKMASSKQASKGATIDNGDEEDDETEAGMPTPDTPEVLGRYANVAYEMGASALPPMLQPHSPGKEGIKEGNKLFFCVIYLAPGDYHHFHSPTNWVAERRRHFRGELYSVSPWMANRLSNLFVLNERVALLGRWRHGFFGMVPVGATNVGSIRINFDKALRTNVRDQRALAGTYSEASYGAASLLLGGQPLAVGDEMGGFLLGSTVVLVFEAPEDFRFDIKPGQKIKVGQRLGDLRLSDEEIKKRINQIKVDGSRHI
ncbi:phosphatidylserine decarboxylase [Violaceomyces palustris]|uniref:Phosphatidylserine decarboxylase n=1 Tax=Violaceomyces palustris TaxID=1673888 RepID=A0ACD0NR39_9BASI|nr:phosphatidylserine decarboxylase [Violaceomyces palustris]